MMSWANLSFPNSNSPIMEQLIFFHDHSMTIIVLITLITLYMIMNVVLNSMTSRFLMEGQEIETLWTIIPAVILIYIALPSLRLLYLMEESFYPSISMKVIGHQWYWSYEYPDFNIELDSFMIPNFDENLSTFRLLDVDNRIVLPYNTNMRILITSADVIHSWTIPTLGVKMDAVPGRLNQISTMASRPGIFYGQCSEICGANHSFMPISMEVTSLNNFLNWIKLF
ncbi:cytochrome c oxidase subunit II (mitochondrion) [Ornithodoros turicata]|uniref:Cytochrome c oxidase subunit 2 n=1 Tax=Ornithodoros turicata TaxID=34597 RepID=A0A3G2JZW2_9ACAR|nr:cytochrome c oxidase subunit II [Ornithodoros turicata]AYN50587.1 cytochrome c oxidase subunit II [Ornithodoros turicata]UYB78693.1 cytochrome c oxidase subunit II [Ornithodoros turicata]UYB78706.1 cytochrome c oxidase subunit II [Ornithodoros turicata]UYB78732.1 cytochrome c oxidase subunit II [Ornithodoros turicata]